MGRTVRLAVISDLHFRHDQTKGAYRTAAGSQGAAFDPVEGLIHFLSREREQLEGDQGRIADYLLCPGDICDHADATAFGVGWEKLKAIQSALGAGSLVATTGNHEVLSRTSEDGTDEFVLPESAIDPLSHLQSHRDYPSTLLRTEAQRWTYWGRGYEIIEDGDVLILLVNSSHFHFTTRAAEYHRGRIGEVALKLLRAELKTSVDKNRERLFIVLLHHHPVPHVDLDIRDLGRTDMYNGSDLMLVLAESGVAWLVIHGHKHHPKLRLASDDGPGRSVIFAAGSGGAELTGELAAHTRLQFYLIDAEVLQQYPIARATGRIRSYSWVDNRWNPCQQRDHGLPDGCGFCIPECDVTGAAKAVAKTLAASTRPYLNWGEILASVPALSTLLPGKIESLRSALECENVRTTWPDSDYYPTDLSYDRK
jgi:hypothetical protein